MKKFFGVVIVFILLVGIIGFNWLNSQAHPNLESISKFASITFPEGTKLIKSADNGENMITAEIELGTSYKEFLKLNRLEGSERLDSKNISKCIDNHLINIINIRGNGVKLEVFYPDFNADPPC